MTLRTVTDADIEALTGLFGDDAVAVDERSLQRASGDHLADPGYRRRPACVIRPESAEQITELLRWANREMVAVTTRGAGSGLAAGCVPETGGLVLEMKRLKRIVEIDPIDRVAVVEAGVVTGALDRALEPYGLFFAGYPMSSAVSQIGGNIATNAGGGRAVKYGVTGRHVLSVEVVTGAGERTVFGGRRRKDAVGYDLRSLLIGSEGTLGVIVGATLSLLPRPEAYCALLVGFDTPRDAIEAMSDSMRSTGTLFSAAEVMDRYCMELGASARRTAPPFVAPWSVLFEADGSNERETLPLIEATAARCGKTARPLLGPDQGKERQQWWAIRESIPWALKRQSTLQGVEDISLPISRLTAVLDRMREIAATHRLSVPTFGHLGDGNMHIHPMIAGEAANGVDADEWKRREQAFLREFYPLVVDAGGTISGEHGVGGKRTGYLDQVLGSRYRELLRGVKRVFDPNGVLNPGKAI